MSERLDPKLEQIPLAQFHYRHEAEFAAGFLDDADIPYRLQVDDAGMGMTISTPATIWIRAMDEEHARELLDLPDRPAPSVDAAVRLAPGRPGGRGAVASYEEQAVRYGMASTPERLSGVERLVSLVLFAGCAGGAVVAVTGSGGVLLAATLGALSAPFGLGALFARTIAPVRGLLRALSGTAP